MLTKNWKSGFKVGLSGDTNTSETFTLPDGTQKTGRFSSTIELFFFNATTVMTSMSDGGNVQGIVFGNGTGVVNENDYNLFGECITGINCTANATYKQEGGNIIKEIEYTVSNTNTSDVTIAEIAYVTNGIFNNVRNIMLLDHTLLDSPVTIPAGGVGQVTYTITFNIA